MKGKVAVGLLLAAACARIGEPPGGPPDSAAPILVATIPDSLGIYPDFTADKTEVYLGEGVVVDVFLVEHIDPGGRVQHTLSCHNGFRYVCRKGRNHSTR